MRSPRRLAAVLTAALALALVSGCADDDEATESGSPASPAAGASSTPSAAPAFPVSIEHEFGTTEIRSAPTRVVSVGYQEQDAILALGVVPVAARYWFGPKDDVIFPWAEEAAGGADIEILTMPDGIDVEKVAVLKPDLIVGIYSDLDQGSYDRLSKIAPTLGKPKGDIDFGTPWDEQLEILGKALGRSEKAEELTEGVRDTFADAAAAHPGWKGLEVAVATFDPELLTVFPSTDPRGKFFTNLGFAIPAEYDELAGADFYVEVSKEKTGLLDKDLLVWDGLSYIDDGRAQVEADQLISRLAVTRAGHVVFMDQILENAFAFSSVLSLPYVVERIVPLIEAALDEDADATASPSATSD